MGKRFTETTKWQDGWFADLTPVHKLAWLYLLDMADAAGGVDLSRRVANLTIGCEIDWAAFVDLSGGRVEVLASGKLFLPGFVEFQYGDLKEDYNPHKPALKLLPRYLEQRNPRLAEGSPKACSSLMDKDKDQDKDKDKDQAQDKKTRAVKKTTDPPIPPALDNSEFREAWGRWKKHRVEIKKPLKPTQTEEQLRDLEAMGLARALVAIKHTIGKGWQGLREPDDQPRAGPHSAATAHRPTVHEILGVKA
jgi:hypothetical protein